MGNDRGTPGDKINRPALVEDQLPVPILGFGPQPAPVNSAFPEWKSWANQRRAASIARHPGTNELWLAASGGVLRWDAGRKNFTRYGSEHGLPGNRCSAIAVDGGGKVWCAPAPGGLYRLDADTWHLHPDAPFRAPVFRHLEVDIQGHVWAAAASGLYHLNLDGSLAQHIPFPAVEPPRSLAPAAGGEVWFCSSLGLFRCAAGQVAQAGKQPTSLVVASAGDELWVGKLDGLVRIELSTNRAHSDAPWPRGTVTALLPSEGGVYAACEDMLGWAAPGRWEPLQQVAPPVSRIIPDGSGGLWIADASGVLHWADTVPPTYLETRYPPDLVEHPTSLLLEYPLPNLVTSLAVDESGILWAGTASGLFRYDARSFGLSAWQYAPRESVQDVMGLARDPVTGCLWLADLAGDLYTCPAQGSPERLPGLPASARGLAPALEGGCWVVTLDGVWQLRRGRWELAVPLHRLQLGVELFSMVQTGPGELWLGTSQGLYRCDFNPEPVISLPKEHPFPRPVTALAYDPDKAVLWAGTQEGLFALSRQGDGWSIAAGSPNHVLNSGLVDNHILALALDGSQAGARKLWISTAGGLCQYQYEP